MARPFFILRLFTVPLLLLVAFSGRVDSQDVAKAAGRTRHGGQTGGISVNQNVKIVGSKRRRRSSSSKRQKEDMTVEQAVPVEDRFVQNLGYNAFQDNDHSNSWHVEEEGKSEVQQNHEAQGWLHAEQDVPVDTSGPLDFDPDLAPQPYDPDHPPEDITQQFDTGLHPSALNAEDPFATFEELEEKRKERKEKQLDSLNKEVKAKRQRRQKEGKSRRQRRTTRTSTTAKFRLPSGDIPVDSLNHHAILGEHFFDRMGQIDVEDFGTDEENVEREEKEENLDRRVNAPKRLRFNERPASQPSTQIAIASVGIVSMMGFLGYWTWEVMNQDEEEVDDDEEDDDDDESEGDEVSDDEFNEVKAATDMEER